MIVWLLEKTPRNTFSFTGKWNNDVGVAGNGLSIEVCKNEEGLNILNFPGLRPILNGLDPSGGHGETVFRRDVAKVFSQGIQLYRWRSSICQGGSKVHVVRVVGVLHRHVLDVSWGCQRRLRCRQDRQ